MENTKDYKIYSGSQGLEEIKKEIEESKTKPATKTGFRNLDLCLEDGLHHGLYIIGGVSSVGKTSLLLQIADQIAESGQPIIYVSLEMGATELIAKSVSRMTLLYTQKNRLPVSYAKTTLGILAGSRYKNYSEKEIEIIDESFNNYKNFSDNKIIVEGIDDFNVNSIRKILDELIKERSVKPILFVDYLQILAPYDGKLTNDKQIIDKNVKELKRLSRDYKIPILAISSLNRESYKDSTKGVITMSSYKESGSIEYSGDVLLAIQFQGAGEGSFDEKKEKDKDPRKIEVLILKYRNGKVGSSAKLYYYPMFNYFEEQLLWEIS